MKLRNKFKNNRVDNKQNDKLKKQTKDLKIKLSTIFLSIISKIFSFLLKGTSKIIFSRLVKLISKNIIEFFVIGLVILTIIFFLLNSIPGTDSLTNIQNEQAKQEIKRKYNLDGKIIERYWFYLKNLFQGDFGISTSFIVGADINSFIWERFLTSMTVGSISLLITLFLGIPLGVIIGMSQSKIVDSFSSFVISIVISVPALIFAIFLLIIGKKLGFQYIYDKESFVTWILPAISLSIRPAVYYIRYIKTEMKQEINSIHANFATVKGVTRLRFVWLHALRPSLFPVITFLPFSFLTIFLGGIFTEKFFQIPGSGGLLLSGIRTKDINIVLFLVILYSLITVFAYNIRDILYKMIDPRVAR